MGLTLEERIDRQLARLDNPTLTEREISTIERKIELLRREQQQEE